MILKSTFLIRWLILIGLVVLLAGCSSQTADLASTPSPDANAVAETPVLITVEPTAAQPAADDVNAENSEDSSSQSASCKDVLVFIKDITIPDGTVVVPESTLDKRWEVENSGNCNWDSSYRVRLIAGPDLGAQKEQALYPARGGTHAIIRIVFKAPTEAGTYRSAWQAYNTQGEPFGDPFFIEIEVGTP